MPYTLQQLSDLEDIRSLKHRYFRAIDTCDREVLADLFTADVTVDYRGGDYRARFSGRQNMLDFITHSFHCDLVAMHQGHSPEITLTGENTAKGTWYLEDINIYIEAQSLTHGTGLYRDDYRRENGGWKICRSELDRVFSVSFSYPEKPRLLAHYLATVGLKPGERKDISHLVWPVPVGGER